MTNTSRPLTTPIINLNGDRASTLLEQADTVTTAISDLISALRDASPHGRNYQCSPAGSYDAARIQYEVHCKLLRDMEQFYTDQYLDLNDQNSGFAKSGFGPDVRAPKASR